MPEDTKRYTGTIIYLDDKGWGFINCHEIEFTRIFFHWSGLNHRIKFRELKKGDTVTFIVKEYPESGTRAIKIELPE